MSAKQQTWLYVPTEDDYGAFYPEKDNDVENTICVEDNDIFYDGDNGGGLLFLRNGKLHPIVTNERQETRVEYNKARCLDTVVLRSVATKWKIGDSPRSTILAFGKLYSIARSSHDRFVMADGASFIFKKDVKERYNFVLGENPIGSNHFDLFFPPVPQRHGPWPYGSPHKDSQTLVRNSDKNYLLVGTRSLVNKTLEKSDETVTLTEKVNDRKNLFCREFENLSVVLQEKIEAVCETVDIASVTFTLTVLFIQSGHSRQKINVAELCLDNLIKQLVAWSCLHVRAGTMTVQCDQKIGVLSQTTSFSHEMLKQI